MHGRMLKAVSTLAPLQKLRISGRIVHLISRLLPVAKDILFMVLMMLLHGGG